MWMFQSECNSVLCNDFHLVKLVYLVAVFLCFCFPPTDNRNKTKGKMAFWSWFWMQAIKFRAVSIWTGFLETLSFFRPFNSLDEFINCAKQILDQFMTKLMEPKKKRSTTLNSVRFFSVKLLTSSVWPLANAWEVSIHCRVSSCKQQPLKYLAQKE